MNRACSRFWEAVWPRHLQPTNRQYKPDCSGFTIDEFLALDLGDMDFSEYVETLSEKAKAEFNQTWAN